jgi:hypothetical protein
MEKERIAGLVFLDIDGVLNSEKYAISFYQKLANHELSGYQDDQTAYCDPEACKKLFDFLDKWNFKVVLTSSYRLNWLDDTRQYFRVNQSSMFKKLASYIVGITPRKMNLITRGQEIEWWKDKAADCELTDQYFDTERFDQPFNVPYVILDDDADISSTRWFVKVDGKTGLDADYVEIMEEYVECQLPKPLDSVR